MIVFVPYINLLNLLLDSKMPIFEEYGDFNNWIISHLRLLLCNALSDVYVYKKKKKQIKNKNTYKRYILLWWFCDLSVNVILEDDI